MKTVLRMKPGLQDHRPIAKMLHWYICHQTIMIIFFLKWKQMVFHLIREWQIDRALFGTHTKQSHRLPLHNYFCHFIVGPSAQTNCQNFCWHKTPTTAKPKKKRVITFLVCSIKSGKVAKYCSVLMKKKDCRCCSNTQSIAIIQLKLQ